MNDILRKSKSITEGGFTSNTGLLSLLIFLAMLNTSCINSKKLAYFQDLSDTSKIYNIGLYPSQPIRFASNDQLQIIISSQSPEASQFFNLMTSVSTAGVAGVGAERSFQNLYIIDANGFITLPVLGDIQCIGLSGDELKKEMKIRLKDYLVDPIITVRLTNFRVTVMGEVAKPVVVPVEGERINVLQALGAAGDMSIYSNRFNVKVMRTTNDTMQVAHLDFNKSTFIQSPFFQLKQNDVVYVEPSKTKGLRSEGFAFWLPLVLSTITALSLLLLRTR
jgi:polysaccharide export outer membrane protein